MKKMIIINGSPRENGVCAELIKQVKPYFTECEIKEYNTYDMSAAACTDCKYCEYHKGCSNKDLDYFFYNFGTLNQCFILIIREFFILQFLSIFNNFII